jgi:hypothetical protein
MLRIRTKRMEVMIAPERDLIVVVIHKHASEKEEKNED